MLIYVLAGINLIEDPFEVLMPTTLVDVDVDVSGNNFQLFDDGDPTINKSQASSIKETQGWSAYMTDVFGEESWCLSVVKERKRESSLGCVCLYMYGWP